jgi:hypothetical protein
VAHLRFCPDMCEVTEEHHDSQTGWVVSGPSFESEGQAGVCRPVEGTAT